MPPPRRGRGRGRGRGRVSSAGRGASSSSSSSPSNASAASSAKLSKMPIVTVDTSNKVHRERVEEIVSSVVHAVLSARYGAQVDFALLPYMVEMMVQQPDCLTSRASLIGGPGQFLVSSGICAGSEDAEVACGAIIDKLALRIDDINEVGRGDRGGPAKLEKSVAIEDDLKAAQQKYKDQVAVLKGAGDEVSKWTKQKQAGSLNVASGKAQRAALRKQKREEAARRKMRMKAAFEVELTYGFDFGPVDPSTTTSLRMDLPTDVVLERFDLAHKKNDGTDLLSNASLTIARGRRYGLIGRNGCGKSTFFDALVQRQIEGVPTDCLIMSTKQHVKGDSRTPLEWLLQAAPLQASLQSRLRDLRHKVQVEEEKQQQAREMAELDLELEDGQDDDDDGGDDDDDDSNNNAGGGTSKNSSSVGGAAKSEKAAAARAKMKEKAVEQAAESANRLKQLLSEVAEVQDELHLLNETQDAEKVRAREILRGLGFSEQQLAQTPTNSLSGGWQMRTSLGCALFASPALLLLDEPTNHLDVETVVWLERYLRESFDKTLMIISHDRFFLNEVVTDIIHFHNTKLDVYKGDYFTFERTVEERKKRQERAYAAQEMKRAHLQEYITKHAELGSNGPKAAAQRKSRMKKLKRVGMEMAASATGGKFKMSYDGEVEDVEAVEKEQETVLTFPSPGDFKGPVVTVSNLAFQYPKPPKPSGAAAADDDAESKSSVDSSVPEYLRNLHKSTSASAGDEEDEEQPLLSDVDFILTQKSRCALLGPNGCGKSTLIKLLLNKLEPTRGKAVLDQRCKIAYVAQHQIDQLDLFSTPFEFLLNAFPGDRSREHCTKLRTHLAAFGLGGEKLPNQMIYTLSGGQKCRLCLALVMYTKPHILIMDEPTNHLDLETVNALIEAIKKFDGGLLIVSHDQYLLQNVVEELWVVGDGTVKRFEGDFLEYKKAIA